MITSYAYAMAQLELANLKEARASMLAQLAKIEAWMREVEHELVLYDINGGTDAQA